MSTEPVGAGGLAAQLRDAAGDAAKVALMTKRLRGLAGLLVARGLKVVIRSPVMTVSKPAVGEADNAPARAALPHLTQSLLLRTTDEGLFWCLVREAQQEGTPELESLCPGADIDEAARYIFETLPGVGS